MLCALCVVRCALDVGYVRGMWDGVEQGREERSEERGARSEECKSKAKSREGASWQMILIPGRAGQTRDESQWSTAFFFLPVMP